MGILDWMKGGAAGKEVKPAAGAPTGSGDKGVELAGLNFKSAVDAHMKWKSRLESYIGGTSTEDLKVEVVCRDDQCALGKWVYSQGGERFGFSETFADMKDHHAHFHRTAGEVLAMAQAGQKDQALRLLHHGDYGRTSERVKMALARLFVLVSDGKAAIDAHQKWKGRLRDVILGKSQEDLSVETTSKDDQCHLGQWLKGVGKERYAHLPAYHWVKDWHVQFHLRAGEVLALARKGDTEAALTMLEEGEYAKASDQVTAALVALFEQQEADRK
ncbi:MAG: CZB domain-containing protein [Rhodocyclaceae bacterium]|nr:CZB domain-containing protein [Rhodocyclaceae bacterium]